MVTKAYVMRRLGRIQRLPLQERSKERLRLLDELGVR